MTRLSDTLRQCEKCGTPFTPRRAIRRYCSKSCANSVTAASRTGVRNGRYKRGGATTPLYAVWHQIVERCTNPRHKRWADYGGRGITVCDEWRQDFGAFQQHVGEPPDTESRWTIDRIDNNRGYEPGNVQWATYSQQAMNRRAGWEQRERNAQGQFS